METELMKDLAKTDGLTQMYNRLSYNETAESINAELREGHDVVFGVVMIDLNDLKRINDEYGHEYGDLALKKIAERIRDAFGERNSFRIGGDEFAAVLRRDEYAVRQAVEAFRRSLTEDAGENPWEQVSAVAGFSMFDPSLDHRFEDTAKRADDLMYRNKKVMKAARQ